MVLNSIIFFCGGIGLFLYGMKLMSDGLEVSTGARLKNILGLLTQNKFLAFCVGFLITAVTQSSTATTVMVVSFVNASLLQLNQTVGVIIGANVGTTITGLIIALKISNIAPLFIFAGTMLLIFSKKRKLKNISMIIMGFGILFFGMQVMKDAMAPLGELESVISLFKYTENPFIGFLLGFVITAIVQSSTASIGILLALVSAGIITDLNQAIFILYGQNLGTCLTTLLSSLGANINAKKAALVHFVYNVIGLSLMFLITVLPIGFVNFVRLTSNDISMQFIYAHIIINILMAATLLPFSKYLLKITDFLVRKEEKVDSSIAVKFIDDKNLSIPSISLVQASLEIERLSRLVLKNYDLAKKMIVTNSSEVTKELEKLRVNEKKINMLSGKIESFLVMVNSHELSYEDAKLSSALTKAITNFGRIGDHSLNLAISADEMFKNRDGFNSEVISEFISMFEDVDIAVKESAELFKIGKYDEKNAQMIKNIEIITDEKNRKFRENHALRIGRNECNSLSSGVFVNILADLERIADHTCNISYLFEYTKN